MKILNISTGIMEIPPEILTHVFMYVYPFDFVRVMDYKKEKDESSLNYHIRMQDKWIRWKTSFSRGNIPIRQN